MQPFDIQQRTRFVFGDGSLDQLGDITAQISAGQGPRARKVMVVCDPGLIDAGHFDHAMGLLQSSGLETASFHDFGENPTSDMVDAGVRCTADFQPDVLVGLGGGSSMDCCKGINFVYCCGGSIHDYAGVGKATTDLLPMIAVPTTAGTGSESQSFALISDAKTHVKMPCGDPRAACRVALLDPTLTLTQPASVTALTGIDALSHAIETYVTKRRNEMSITYSRRAFGMLASGFPRVLDDPNDLEARSQMQLGASLAGMAIETSMLGAAHATANPLTARHGIAHGQAVGLMLPAVIRLNGQQHQQWYAELLRELDLPPSDQSPSDRLADLVQQWVRRAGLATNLADLAIPSGQIDEFADDALRQWTGTFNPIALDADNVRSLYLDVAE
ncbi:iron-containing alcohol dehydrogenase [Crateriforma conspicua]|uniref:NAD-dependent methanol dehydrogenase n=1 Tax=Crateriforma conspicua TaxID=2527996 RepID=A0A5C5YB15_9PLAN|nr:iron-containing alcohol dehydrogenase [Crateriforma conspicua]QDV61592.1 NAD-dependent methanol dehydrogenase [Crateriforma conspicua]TWT72159.1 NAD-dependent methanol dehydrogenase [Crateriforma conspicua]